jgi:hypothetical protein
VRKISPPDKLILSVLKSKDQKFREFSITTMMICGGKLLASLLLMGTQLLNGQSLETVPRRHDRVASHSIENVRPGPEVRAAKRLIVTICDGRPIRSLMQKVTARSFL